MNYKKLKSIVLLIFLIPILVLSGCNITGGAVADLDYIKAKKLTDYHENKYKDLPATGILENGVRTIKIKAYQFYFEPTTIIVNKGEKIKLIIEAMDIPHGFEIEGFKIQDYDINTVIRKGAPLILEFSADEEGIWTFICTIFCGSAHSTMRGTFVVR